MKTKNSSIILMVFCTFFTSTAQVFLKKGANNLLLNKGLIKFVLSSAKNLPLIIGCLLYFVAAIIFLIALKNGELSVLYPIIATSYFWVTLLSIFYLKEQVSYLKWMGIVVIFIGIIFVGVGSKKYGS